MLNTIRVLAICLFMGLLASTPAAAATPEDAKAESKFDAFKTKWIQTLTSRGTYGPKYVQVLEKGGVFVATYKEIGKPLSSRVKKRDRKALHT
jgi:hypothetical protein